MDKKIAGLLGAAAALATVGGANAANATEVPGNPGNPAANYRELLNPVPNALAALKADDARRANESTPGEQSGANLDWGRRGTSSPSPPPPYGAESPRPHVCGIQHHHHHHHHTVYISH